MVIAGGTGFLGSILTKCFVNEYEVVVLTRGISEVRSGVTYIHWDGKALGNWARVVDGADVVINLNGKSVDCRYTPNNKALIYSTRLDATVVLGSAIQQSASPPVLWINAASATIYRHSEDKDMDEQTGEMGTGFSVDVCQQWEAVFNSIDTPRTRKVLMRTGIVLGRNGGPLIPLKTLAMIGLGGRQGDGNQYFSWIHEDDFARIVKFLIINDSCTGAYNVTAPVPKRNTEMMRFLRKAVKVPFGLPLPGWLLEIGALIIRTETELVLKSRRVVPARLIQAGYQFKYEELADCIDHLVNPSLHLIIGFSMSVAFKSIWNVVN